MNFSGIPYKSHLGRVLRYSLRVIPSEAEVRILQGKLRGKRWIAGSGVNGYWLGSFEYHKQKAIEKIVAPGSVVYDVGAHVGYYTLLFSELIGPAGQVVAFEPNPRNIRYLRKHLEINDIANVRLVQAAASDAVGVAAFADNSGSSTGCLSEQGGLQVATMTLDQFAQYNDASKPDHIKIDVEGAELSVLHGARELLTSRRPTLFLATHGPELHMECCTFLDALGYWLAPLAPSASVLDTDEIIALGSDDPTTAAALSR